MIFKYSTSLKHLSIAIINKGNLIERVNSFFYHTPIENVRV